MISFIRNFFLACGLLLTLAAFPVFAQEADRIELNKKPLEDFAEEINRRVDEKKIDLTKSFSVELSGDLNKDGTLDRKTARFTKSEDDVEMIGVGKMFIEAIDNAGFFKYLKNLGIEKINLILGQDDKQTYAVIKSELPNASRAATIKSGLSLLLQIAGTKDSKSIGEDEKFFINGAKVENADKTVIIKVLYEKSAIHEFIERKLKQSEEKRREEQKPSGE